MRTLCDSHGNLLRRNGHRPAAVTSGDMIPKAEQFATVVTVQGAYVRLLGSRPDTSGGCAYARPLSRASRSARQPSRPR